MSQAGQSVPTVYKLQETALDPYPPVAEQVLEGRLAMRARILWKSLDNVSATGIWQCPPVKLSLRHPFDETFVITHGWMTITAEDGVARDLRAGDAIVLREGSINVWHVHETVTKLFSIYRDGGLPI